MCEIFPKSRLIKTHPWRIDSSWMSSDQRRVVISTRWRTADRLNINMSSYQYGVYRHTDKAVVRPVFFSLWWESMHLEIRSLFWNRAQLATSRGTHSLNLHVRGVTWNISNHPWRQRLRITTPLSSGGWFNINMPSYQYRKSRCGDKTTLRPSYLHNEISYTGKMASLHWIRALVSNAPSCGWQSCCTVGAQFWLVQP